jgi:dihydrofolate synthase/folylpolyglutamate synthase
VNRLFPALEARRALGEDAFPTFFELMTALRHDELQVAPVDRGIFEVGLGGRLDATNILTPQLTAITSIGLEHTQQLGDTLAKIAREKAGIVKEGTLLVLGPVPDEARREILQIAAARHAPVVEVDPASASSAGPARST